MSLATFHERRHEVIKALGALRAVSSQIGTHSLAGRIDSEIIQRLEADRFHLVVVGEFNHGKSTFVNALLGRVLLPAGVTPTTAVIHHLHYAPEPVARVVYNDGAAESITLEQLRYWAVGDDAAQTSENVKFIELGYPAKLLEDRIVLVDTPGVNDLSHQRADITYSYIPRSDAVIFLLDAGQMLKESERVFLVEKLIGKSRDKIIFVVNKVDIWSPEERGEALGYVHQQLSKLVKDPVIFPLSAQAVLAGRGETSGMPELLAHLTRFLGEERGRIMLDHALAEGLGVAGLLRQGLDAKRIALRMSSEELDRRIAIIKKDAEGQLQTIDQRRATIREEVSAIKAWARRDLERFVDDVSKQIPTIVDKASSDEIRQHLAAFLEQTFREWAQAETQEIASALEQLAEKIIALVKEDAQEAGKKLGDALAIKAPSIDVDTFAYDVGIFALFTIGIGTMFTSLLLGGMLTLAAPLLALYVRDKVEVETRKRAKEMGPTALRDAAAQVGPKLDEMIDAFATELDTWVVTTAKEMYRGMLEVLTAARSERDSRKSTDESALSLLETDTGKLAEVQGHLESMRSQLWAGGVPGVVEPRPGLPSASIPVLDSPPVLGEIAPAAPAEPPAASPTAPASSEERPAE
jgi:GTPase SAR1 family protein